MKFLSDILAKAGLVVDGNVTLNSVANATTDTDKFLTIDSGVVKFRTGAQLLSDIGGQAALTNPVTGTGTSGQVAYFDGANSITSNAAFAFTPTSQLLVNNSVTASSAIARGQLLNTTLVAAANNDVLVGLDINPTFTIGAFTGVSGIGLRLNNTGFRLENGISGSTTFYNITTNSYAFTNRTSTTSVGSVGSAAWGLWDNTRINGFFGHGGSNVNIGVSIGGAQVGAWFATGNLFVGSSPADGGFKLDVNGTARVSGAATLSNLAGTGTRMVVADANGLLSTQAIASGSVTGTGTTNYIPKFTSSSSIGNSIIFDDGNCIGINTSSPYSASQFKLDVNGGFIVKNTSGVNAQFVMINSDPAAGGNNAFFVQTVGGSTTTTWAQIQTYYGTSIAAGALRLQPAGGQILVGTTTASAFTVDISGTLRVSGQLTLGSTITNGTFTYTLPGATGTLALTSDITTAVANLVASAPGALDTLNELAAALGNDAAFSTTVTTALGNRLRVDTASQGLTGTQQGNGRTNLGLGSLAILSSVGNANITDLAYSKLTGVPSTFAPSAHTHVWTDITDRPTNLSAFTNGPGYITSSSLSSYVPYTGATTSVDLGTNNMSAQLYRLEGTGSSGAYLAIKQYAGSLSGAPGYTSIYAVTQNSLYIRYSQTDGSQKNVELSSALLGTTTRQYLFPNASGTFALTSDIPTVAGVYLPLSGGTLTGALGGTSATFSGNVLVNGEGNYIGIDATGGAPRLGFVKVSGAQPFLGFAADPFTIKVSSGSTIATSNTFTTALSIATSGAATFSSSVTATNMNVFGTTELAYVNGVTQMRISRSGSVARIQNYDGGSVANIALNWEGGNVGIGTTSPLSTLHVNGSDAGFRITGSSRAQMILANGLSQWQLESPTGVSNVPAGAFGIIESGVGSRLTILTGGDIGIGTTAPLYRLEVQNATGDDHIAAIGTAPSIQFASANSGPANWGTVGMATATNNFLIGAVAGDLAIINRGTTAGNILFGFGSTERVRITNAGFVGIGTTGPAERLTVAGGNFRLNGVNANSRFIVYQDYSNSAVGVQLFNTSGASVIDLNGNAGNINITGSITGAKGFFSSNAASDNTTAILGNASTNDSTTFAAIFGSLNAGYRMHVRGDGQLRLHTYTSSSAWTGTAVATLGVDSSGNVITVTGGGGSSQWTTSGSNIYYNTGSVGIGTTAPVLHSSTTGLVVRGSGRGIIELWDATSGKSVFQNVGGDTYIGQLDKGTGAGRLYLLVNGNGSNADIAMTMLANGSVGINTTSPSDKLEVRGADDGITISSIVANRPVLKFVNGSTTMLKLSANGLYGAIADNTGNDTVFFKDGRVGIGTTSPVANFHIASNTNTGIRINATASNGSAELDLLSNGTQSAFIDYGPNQLRFRSTNADMSVINNGSVLVLDNGGYVGLGTTSPGYKLHVLTSDNEGIYLQGTGGGVWMNIKSAAGKMWSYGAQNDGCGIYNRTDGVYRMFIADSGAATFSSSITCTSLTETSTIKVKENIVSIDSALDQVEKLQAVSYNRKGSSVKEIGLIAEAVEEVYPEFVQYDQNGEPVGLNYSRLTAVLIESVKELKNRIQELEKRN